MARSRRSKARRCATPPDSSRRPTDLRYPPASIDDIPNVCRPVAEGGVLQRKGQVEVISSLERDGTPIGYDIRFGVFVVFEGDSEYIRNCFREYMVRTDSSGRYACLYKRWHLIGLEVGISVASIGVRGEATGAPVGFNADVVATAKRDLAPGETLDGEGGYTVWGKLLPAATSLALHDVGGLPLGLAHGVRMLRAVRQGQSLTWRDVQIDETLPAYRTRREMEAEFAPVDVTRPAAQERPARSRTAAHTATREQFRSRERCARHRRRRKSPNGSLGGAALLRILTALFGLIASVSTLGFDTTRPAVRYLIPDGYVGWVRIDYGINAAHAPGYGVERALALPKRDGVIVAEFPPSGHLVTSSEMEFGSAADQYFYSSATKLTPLSQAKGSQMVWNKINGRLGGAASQTEIFFVGSEADYMKYAYRHAPVPMPGPVKR